MAPADLGTIPYKPLKERSASQEHFIDLCRLLGEQSPAEVDPYGDTYCFERGARKDSGGEGLADVGKRHHFACEHKGRKPTSTKHSNNSGSTRWPWRTRRC